MIPALLAHIGVPVLSGILSDVLKEIDVPVTKGAADALQKLDQALQAGEVSAEQIAEANRHAERIAEIKMKEHVSNLSSINETLRAEVASQDLYVRRMRPTFGYLMALTWAAQMFGIAYVIVFETQRSGEVLNAMGSLSAIWAVGLSVLGVYVYKRSEDKKLRDKMF